MRSSSVRAEYSSRTASGPGCHGGPDHRHQRSDAAPAGEQLDGVTGAWLPHEVAADRPTQLDPVPRHQVLDEKRRDLALVDELHGDLDSVSVLRSGDRIGALRLVAVFGGEADVDVLAGAVAGPSGDIQHDRANPRVSSTRSTTSARSQLSRPRTAARATGHRSCDSRTPPRSQGCRSRPTPLR